MYDWCPGADLMAVPFPLARKMRFDRIGVYVAGAGISGAQFRLGVYDDLNVYPNNLLVDSGVIDGTTTGDKIVTIDETLDKELYWLVFHANTQFGSNGRIRDAEMLNMMTNQGLASLSAMLPLCDYAVSRAFGPLPETFPAGANEYTAVPMIALRLAELL